MKKYVTKQVFLLFAKAWGAGILLTLKLAGSFAKHIQAKRGGGGGGLVEPSQEFQNG